MNPIVKVKDLSFGYTPQEAILKGLSFEVMPQAFLVIAGPNGAGKTTLLNLLCGLLKSDSGSVEIDSAPIESYSVKKLARKVAVVRQEFLPVFDFRVVEIVSMARAPYLGAFGFEGKADKETVAEALEMTETTRFASRTLSQLSSGERQMVFIARALAQDTPVLLLDEPTSFLDLKHQVAIYDLLRKLQIEKDKTIIAVTHDINLSAQYCDRALLLGCDTSYRHGCTEDVICREQIEKIFDVRTFVGTVGREKFFIPLGEFAKDRDTLNATVRKIKKNNPINELS